MNSLRKEIAYNSQIIIMALLKKMSLSTDARWMSVVFSNTILTSIKFKIK